MAAVVATLGAGVVDGDAATGDEDVNAQTATHVSDGASAARSADRSPADPSATAEPRDESTPSRYAATGRFVTVPGAGAPYGDDVPAFAVEVEQGLDVDTDEVAAVVEEALFDPRSWAANGQPLRRVDSGEVAFRVTLATPETTDRLCKALGTKGIFSCWNGHRAVLNAMRWHDGAEPYEDEGLHGYRLYLINHEVGHALGHDHASCPAAGGPAPIMMQQTKTVGACTPNPYPFPDG